MENDIIRSGYDAMGESYHQRRVNKQAVNYAYFDQLSSYWPTSGTVLDLGCGGGVPVTKYFFDKGLTVSGVDISPAMIDIARKEIPEGTFQVGDMANLDFPAESFDLIVSTFAIIHVQREKHAALFAHLYTWLKE
ncbi:MAG: class I SAM-dependent methyltransferase [Bacteroidota bacterium]